MVKRQFWFTLGCCVVASAFTSTLVGAQSRAHAAAAALEAGEFRLMDAAGEVRARLGFDSENNVRLTFSDPGGTSRLWTGVTADGTSTINLRDKSGKPRIFVQVGDGEPLISLRDGEDKGRLYIQVSGNEPLINLLDKDSKGRVFLRVTEEGPAIWFADENGATTFLQR